MNVRIMMVLIATVGLLACEAKTQKPEEKPAPAQAQDASAEAPKAEADAAGSQNATTEGGKKIVIKKDPTKAPDVFAVSDKKIVIKLKPPKPEAFANPKADQVGTLPEGVGQGVGSTIEPFDIVDTEGKPVTWADLTGKAPLLVAFYRGGWCRWCNYQVRRYAKNFNKFEELGLNLVFISVDDIEGANVTKAAYKVPFPLLSDPDLKAHTAFNVIFDVDAKELERLESIDIDLTAWSKRKHHKIAVPSLFLIDKDGVVKWAHAEKNFRVRPSLEQVLEAITPLVKK